MCPSVIINTNPFVVMGSYYTVTMWPEMWYYVLVTQRAGLWEGSIKKTAEIFNGNCRSMRISSGSLARTLQAEFLCPAC